MDQQQRGVSYGNAHNEHGDLDPGPCRGCINAERCALNSLACMQFSMFANRSSRWRFAPKQPTREIFARVFNAADLAPGGRRG